MQPSGDDGTIVEVWINCPDHATASSLAERLIGQRLAAAANILPAIESRYRWRGEVRSASEVPLLLKTRGSLFEALAAWVREHHPYDTPSIVAKALDQVDARYRAWLLQETAG